MLFFAATWSEIGFPSHLYECQVRKESKVTDGRAVVLRLGVVQVLRGTGRGEGESAEVPQPLVVTSLVYCSCSTMGERE